MQQYETFMPRTRHTSACIVVVRAFKPYTSRTDHGLPVDHLDPKLPLGYVVLVQDLCTVVQV